MIVVTDVMQLLLVAIDLDRALVTSRRTSSPNSGGTTSTFVDYGVLSHRSPAQLLERRAEATSLSSVCRRRRRVLVPTILETVILNSELEAKTFVYMLRLKHVRPYIKNLRIEGGLFTQFSRISLDSRLSVSLNVLIPSKDKTSGLCSVLKLINPKHLILRDSNALRNQGVSNVIDVLIECMTSVWSNLVRVPLDMFCFPHVLIVLLRFHTNILMMNICGSITFLGPVTVHVICALQI